MDWHLVGMMKATTNCCSICGSNGFKTELPRMKPTWFGWKLERGLDGLQLMGDDDGIWTTCSDCEVKETFWRWSLGGVWRYPLKQK